MLLITLTADELSALTTPGLAALLTLLFGSAPFGSPSYLSHLKLYDPSLFLGLETSVQKG